MRAVTSFSWCGSLGEGLLGIADAEHPGLGCRLRKGGGVGEGAGGGGDDRRSDGGGRGRVGLL